MTHWIRSTFLNASPFPVQTGKSESHFSFSELYSMTGLVINCPRSAQQASYHCNRSDCTWIPESGGSALLQKGLVCFQKASRNTFPHIRNNKSRIYHITATISWRCETLFVFISICSMHIFNSNSGNGFDVTICKCVQGKTLDWLRF